MTDDFLFSFVVAVYNVESYLDEAIASIVAQTVGFSKIQLILVDDGSGDGSLEICNRWKARYPDNIVVVHQENAGVSTARNNGLGYVRGRYVSFMDSDDKIVPPTCERVAKFFDEHPGEIDLVAIPMVFFEAAKGDHILNVKFAKGNRVINLDREWSYPQLSMSSAFVKAEALRGIRFDVRLKHLEDMKVVQTILLAKRAYGVISTVRYQYRRRAGAAKSAVQSATRRKTWYVDTLKYASEELFDNAERQGDGRIPKYIQYAVMYDLQWRLSLESIQGGVLTPSEVEEYRDKVVSLLRRIDADVIMAQRNIFSEHKIYALLLRNQEPLEVRKLGNDGFAFCCGSVALVRASRIPVNMEFLWCERGRLVADISLCLPESVSNDVRAFARIGSLCLEMAVLGEKVVSRSMGVPILRRRYCRFEVPLEAIASVGCRLEFLVEWQGHRVPLRHLVFGRFFPLSDKYLSSYWADGGVAVSSSSRKWLWVEPASRKVVIRRECNFLRDLWRKNLLGARKAVLARLIVHAARTVGYRPFWLVSDRATAARDNGEAFFEYMRREHPEQKVYFAINRGSVHYKRLKKIGPILARNGFAYKLRLLLADWIVSSQAEEQVTDPFWGYDASYKDMLANRKYVFLGHGITQNDISGWIGRYKKGITGIVAASVREAEAFCGGDYGYERKNVWLTGLPRYDRLYHAERRQILIMPTWRRELMGSPDSASGAWSLGPDFRDSEYYRFYNGLINSQRLLAAARTYGYTIGFLPHPNLQPYAGEFVQSDGVEFIDSACEYKDVFAQGDALVTDYSSVAFDFAYLRKPVVYSQFDRAAFYERTSVLKPGYFDYRRDGFGPVAESLDGVVDELVRLMAGGCKLSREYRRRIDAFFAFSDSNNCRRVYERMLEMRNG